jgi:hypothetical protein
MSKHFQQMPLITYACFPVGREEYIRMLHKHQPFVECAVIITDLCPAYTDMRRLTTGIHSEKCVGRRFHRFANAIECTYTYLDIVAYYTPGRAYCS